MRKQDRYWPVLVAAALAARNDLRQLPPALDRLRVLVCGNAEAEALVQSIRELAGQHAHGLLLAIKGRGRP